MKAKILERVKGINTSDGAGVKLVRVLSNKTVESYDPFLMLDSFDSTNYDDYKAGFPMHPHRGIETITYLSAGHEPIATLWVTKKPLDQNPFNG